MENKLETFYPKNQEEWRKWLQSNHISKQSIWVIFYKKSSGKPTITWSEAVDEALCFGWIDSVKKKLDEERSIQFFSKRKPNSTWSKINKEKVKQLIANNKLMPAGLACIEIAKKNGSWTILDDVEELIIPADLEQEFKKKKGAKNYFQSLSKSTQKALLQWVVLAKQKETRNKRITEIVDCAAKGQKPKHLQ